MIGHGQKWTRKREAAIAALLSEPTHAKAAEKAGIGVATLGRWLKGPAFLAQYRAARRQLVEGALGQLQQATAEAVCTLRSLLLCEHAPTRARAAIAILEQAQKAVELTDLVAEVEAIKRQLQEVHDKRAGQGADAAAAAGRNGRGRQSARGPAASRPDLDPGAGETAT